MCLEEMAEGQGKMFKMARTEEVWAVPKNLLKRLIVVEVWPEKKNIAIVGNGKYLSCSFATVDYSIPSSLSPSPIIYMRKRMSNLNEKLCLVRWIIKFII